jgi:hypothetical protein
MFVALKQNYALARISSLRFSKDRRRSPTSYHWRCTPGSVQVSLRTDFAVARTWTGLATDALVTIDHISNP